MFALTCPPPFSLDQGAQGGLFIFTQMAKVPYAKPPLTYQNQLQQLKNRGLIVENDGKALHLLESISYYRLSGYWYPLLSNPKSVHNFKIGATFNTAFNLYCFDRQLRQLILNELEKIEVSIRAVMIYILSSRHGSFWYTNSNIFANPASHGKTMANLGKEYGRSDERFILDFKVKYSDPMPPSWMMLEVTSFGSLSILYQNLKSTRDKRDIAHYFGLDSTTFQSWLHSIVYVRNVCAHHSRLWNRVMRITPQIPLNPSHSWISITSIPNRVTGQAPINLNNRTYFLLSIIVYLLNRVNPKNTFKQKFHALLTKYPSVDVRAMGFPENWQAEVLWDWKSAS